MKKIGFKEFVLSLTPNDSPTGDFIRDAQQDAELPDVVYIFDQLESHLLFKTRGHLDAIVKGCAMNVFTSYKMTPGTYAHECMEQEANGKRLTGYRAIADFFGWEGKSGERRISYLADAHDMPVIRSGVRGKPVTAYPEKLIAWVEGKKRNCWSQVF